MRRAFDTVYDLRDEILRVRTQVAAFPTQAASGSNLSKVVQSTSQLPAYQLFNAGVSSALNLQASFSPIVVGAMAYTSTTTTITWYWDGTSGSTLLTIICPDNSTLPIPAGSLTVTGLAANTGYNFYPYFDLDSGMMVFSLVTGGSGTPAVAYGGVVTPGIPTASLMAAALQVADRHVVVSSTGSVVGITPAAGTGGGSGGGSGGGGGRSLD